MAEVWKSRRDEVLESAGSVIAAVEHGETFAGRSASLTLGLVDKLVTHAVTQFDPRYGGFGAQPKFPHPSAIDLLLDVATRTGNQEARTAATVTLEKMALGGVYDQLAGGFHRYSVDERWIVPHFEKMLYDNAGLLKNYTHAFQTLVNPESARVAKDIIRWMDEWLTDREQGGFYASQDADVSLDDDGDYFTWTRTEAAAVLTAEEMGVAGPYYDIGDVGDMHHNPSKNVLHVKYTVEEIAARAKLPAEKVLQILESARQKLYAARLSRPTPFVDQTLYTGWNALGVSAYIAAARVLNLDEPLKFALKTLDRLLNEGWDPAKGLAHVIAYSDGVAGKQRIAGVLDDYAFLAEACLDAWEANGSLHYYQAAVEIAEGMTARFYDPVGGGFFDSDLGDKPVGALSARRKPLQDSPTPAGNPAAAAVLVRVADLSGRGDLREKAEDTLENFAGIVEHFGLYAGTYGLALERLMLDPQQVFIVGEGAEARRLEATATAGYAVNKSVIRLRREQIKAGELPPALAETLPNLPEIVRGNTPAFAIVCRGKACLPPTADPERLLEELSVAV
jgi:hypothetical protein